MTVKIDTTGLDDLLKEFDAVLPSVKIGVLESATPDVDDGDIYTKPTETIAEYAAKNEFGTAQIPSRPFLRNTIKNKSEEWQDVLSKLLTQKNLDIETALTAIGEAAAADVRDTINAGRFRPNAPLTIQQKREKGRPNPDHPLIDSANMLSSIGYEVIKK